MRRVLAKPAAPALALLLALTGCAVPAARPPASTRPTPAESTAASEPVPARSLAELIAMTPGLSGFRALAAAGDLPSLLAGRGGATVLAPTDAALARLAPGTLESLLLPGNRPSLRHLLRFWIMPAPGWMRARAGVPVAPVAVATLDGEALAVTFRSGASATVTDAAGRRATVSMNVASEGGTLATLDSIVAPRSIEPGATARPQPRP